MGPATEGAGNLFIAQNSLKQLSRVDAKGVIHRSELKDNWDRAQAPTKLVPIEPLR